MSITSRSQVRQSVLVARCPFTFADLPDTAFVPAIQLPADAVILRGYLAVTTAFDATSTIDVGIAGTATKYLAAGDVDGAAILPLTGLTGASAGAIETIGLTSSEAQAAGAGALVVEYIRTGRVQATEG